MTYFLIAAMDDVKDKRKGMMKKVNNPSPPIAANSMAMPTYSAPLGAPVSSSPSSVASNASLGTISLISIATMATSVEFDPIWPLVSSSAEFTSKPAISDHIDMHLRHPKQTRVHPRTAILNLFLLLHMYENMYRRSHVSEKPRAGSV